MWKQRIANLSSNYNLYGNSGGGGKFGDQRLPNFYELNLRLEKVFGIWENATVTVLHGRLQRSQFQYDLSVAGQITSSQYKQVKRIVNPRVFRFGVRFQF